ncbi:hypothetical protein M2281_002227 [Mesorhizobium soli]|uniref:DUF3305 domain-containing protein n=1 Tax=Pseudaminobacter soli (ex Li et al. 2025) TaxID=1295366 RepID=UPI0024741FD2|nr:DUF3305 domain-containing protein [Mesorhizobium soli]MDH6231629.1 hypothetical protein [Mesorhizobium soli]
MSNPMPHLSIPAGIVVERRKAASSWIDFTWRPVSVLVGKPAAEPGTCLGDDGESATFYAGAVSLDLYRTETSRYRDNLTSPRPSVWVAIVATDGVSLCSVVAATIDPAEGEALSEPGTLVEAVPLPHAIADQIAEFVARHPVEDSFVKRKRDRANPEALARRLPTLEKNDDRE